jgi:hypothetical protein
MVVISHELSLLIFAGDLIVACVRPTDLVLSITASLALTIRTVAQACGLVVLAITISFELVICALEGGEVTIN